MGKGAKRKQTATMNQMNQIVDDQSDNDIVALARWGPWGPVFFLPWGGKSFTLGELGRPSPR